MRLDHDTIAAVATAPGRGGVGIIRLSGAAALDIAEKITKKNLVARYATYTGFFCNSGDLLDSGIAIFFPAPKSFTGEHVVELQGHGSPIMLDMILNATLQYGARLARPGEFSERAFLNNKLDLVQAEAVADLVAASNVAAVRSAAHSLQGVFSEEVNRLIEKLVALRAYVEAAIDFPDEDVEFLNNANINEQLVSVENLLTTIFKSAQQGALINEGMTLVIAGKPNVGKSTLLNALAQRDVAIVTEIAGTTRDVLREEIEIDGLPLHIVDTAGLRESNDPVELEGMRRAKEMIKKADHILLVTDVHASTDADIWPAGLVELPEGITSTIVRNKSDINQVSAKQTKNIIFLSAKTGDGIELLRQRIKQVAGYQVDGASKFSARRRHLNALQNANGHIQKSLEHLRTQTNNELVAEELRLAQLDLEAITGRFTADDLLEKIFREFCLGK